VEGEAQALVFSPSKITQVRQRKANLEEAERQRRQNVSGRKLQMAIPEAEKAHEAAEKKMRRDATR